MPTWRPWPRRRRPWWRAPWWQRRWRQGPAARAPAAARQGPWRLVQLECGDRRGEGRVGEAGPQGARARRRAGCDGVRQGDGGAERRDAAPHQRLHADAAARRARGAAGRRWRSGAAGRVPVHDHRQVPQGDGVRRAAAAEALDQGLKLQELATHEVVTSLATMDDTADGQRMALAENAAEQGALLAMRNGPVECPVSLEPLQPEAVYEGHCGHMISMDALLDSNGAPPADGSLRRPQCRKSHFVRPLAWPCGARRRRRSQRAHGDAGRVGPGRGGRGGDPRRRLPHRAGADPRGAAGPVRPHRRRHQGLGRPRFGTAELVEDRVSRVRDLPLARAPATTAPSSPRSRRCTGSASR